MMTEAKNIEPITINDRPQKKIMINDEQVQQSERSWLNENAARSKQRDKCAYRTFAFVIIVVIGMVLCL